MLLPAAAWAHPLLERAQRLYDEAEFQQALDVYAQAEQATDLSRDDLVALYRQRALVHHAMGNASEVELDLFRLATLEPDLQLGNQVPPAVRRAFDEAKGRVTGPLRVTASAERIPSGVRVSAQIENDLAAIVQSVRIVTRTGDESWSTVERPSAEVPAAAGASFEYFAEALGPGGAVVAWAGTRSDPRRLGEGAGAQSGGGLGGQDRVDTGGGVPVWPFIAGGVAVAGAVVLVLVLTSASSDMTDVMWMLE